MNTWAYSYADMDPELADMQRKAFFTTRVIGYLRTTDKKFDEDVVRKLCDATHDVMYDIVRRRLEYERTHPQQGGKP